MPLISQYFSHVYAMYRPTVLCFTA